MIAIVALALTLLSSMLVALRLCAGSVGTLVLGTYVTWVAQIVVLSLALSALGELGATGYLVGAGAVCAAAVALHAARRTSLPPLGSTLRAVIAALRADRVLVCLVAVVTLELVYVLAIALLTPPVDDDSLQYHLGRPALWLQQGSLGTFDPVYDFRMNAFPVNAELVYGFFLAAWGGDRLVALTNVFAAMAVTVAVGVGARRIGLSLREALFGALLAASLPVIALQAPSTLTDLQVAALATSSTALFLRRSTSDLALGATALGLGMATKVTGVFAVPVLALVALATWRPRWWPPLVAVAVGVAVGSYWYAWNLVREGSPLGETSPDQRGVLAPADAVARVLRMSVDLFDLPGAVGRDRYVYEIAAVLLLALGAGLAIRGSRSRHVVLAALLVALCPLVLVLGRLYERATQKLWFVVGRPDLDLDLDRVETVASSMQSGAGPVGLVLIVVGLVLVTVAMSRREVRRLALVLAAAPLLWIVTIGAAVAYFRWNARFTLPGFTLAAMTWGIAARVRWLAVALSTIAAVTLLLSFTHFFEKPAGIRLLEPRDARSAFTTPRPDAMAWDPRVVPLLRYLDRELPQNAAVASFPVFYPRHPEVHIELEPDAAPELLTYMLFGRSLARHVDLAIDPAAARRTVAQWYLIPATRLGDCTEGWVPYAQKSGWAILRRSPETTCAG